MSDEQMTPKVPFRAAYWRYWLIFVPLCMIEIAWKAMKAIARRIVQGVA